MTLTPYLFRPASGGHPLAYVDTHSKVAGPPPSAAVVFVHAFPLGAGMWLPQMLGTPPGWRFVAPAVRGFDATEEWLDHGRAHIDQYADDVLAVMNHLGIGRAVVVGLSMGGYVAFAMFRKAPDRFSGLLLADTRATSDSPEARQARLAMLERVEREGPHPWLADQMIPKLLSERTIRRRPNVVATVREIVQAQTAAAIRGAVQRMLLRPDSTDELSRIAVPTAIVVGEHDTLTPLSDAKAMQAGIRGAVLEVVPEAAHLSNIEQPDDFNMALGRLLQKVGEPVGALA